MWTEFLQTGRSAVFLAASAANLKNVTLVTRRRDYFRGFWAIFPAVLLHQKRSVLVHMNWLAHRQLVSSQHRDTHSEIEYSVSSFSVELTLHTYTHLREILHFVCLFSSVTITLMVDWGFVNRSASLRERKAFLLNGFGLNQTNSDKKVGEI